jgi:hypothetical protein
VPTMILPYAPPPHHHAPMEQRGVVAETCVTDMWETKHVVCGRPADQGGLGAAVKCTLRNGPLGVIRRFFRAYVYSRPRVHVNRDERDPFMILENDVFMKTTRFTLISPPYGSSRTIGVPIEYELQSLSSHILANPWNPLEVIHTRIINKAEILRIHYACCLEKNAIVSKKEGGVLYSLSQELFTYVFMDQNEMWISRFWDQGIQTNILDRLWGGILLSGHYRKYVKAIGTSVLQSHDLDNLKWFVNRIGGPECFKMFVSQYRVSVSKNMILPIQTPNNKGGENGNFPLVECLNFIIHELGVHQIYKHGDAHMLCRTAHVDNRDECLECLKLLCEKFGYGILNACYNVEQGWEGEWTVLQTAAFVCWEGGMDWMLSHGADPNIYQDGESVHYILCQAGTAQMVKDWHERTGKPSFSMQDRDDCDCDFLGNYSLRLSQHESLGLVKPSGPEELFGDMRAKVGYMFQNGLDPATWASSATSNVAPLGILVGCCLREDTVLECEGSFWDSFSDMIYFLYKEGCVWRKPPEDYGDGDRVVLTPFEIIIGAAEFRWKDIKKTMDFTNTLREIRPSESLDAFSSPLSGVQTAIMSGFESHGEVPFGEFAAFMDSLALSEEAIHHGMKFFVNSPATAFPQFEEFIRYFSRSLNRIKTAPDREETDPHHGLFTNDEIVMWVRVALKNERCSKRSLDKILLLLEFGQDMTVNTITEGDPCSLFGRIVRAWGTNSKHVTVIFEKLIPMGGNPFEQKSLESPRPIDMCRMNPKVMCLVEAAFPEEWEEEKKTLSGIHRVPDNARFTFNNDGYGQTEIMDKCRGEILLFSKEFHAEGFIVQPSDGSSSSTRMVLFGSMGHGDDLPLCFPCCDHPRFSGFVVPETTDENSEANNGDDTESDVETDIEIEIDVGTDIEFDNIHVTLPTQFSEDEDFLNIIRSVNRYGRGL